jgi:hypothetical protein
MSLSLLVTNVIERLRSRQPESPPPAGPPKPDPPHTVRERLRQQVLARGGTLTEIETIRGDCPAQTAQQIADLSRWLEGRA